MSVQTGAKKKEGGIAETVRVLFNALIIALVIRTFLFQPFNIPSGSMIPTLLVGDYLFVSKYSYGYTHYSLPFSPRIFSGRVLGGTLKRGDVVVFRLPKDDSIDYIKRVIGLPGDKIQMIDGVLNINGEPVKRERIDDFVTDDDGVMQRVKRYKETLTNGVVYTTLDLTENGFYDNTPVYTVPPDHYFMMGDNRDNSTDSRVLSAGRLRSLRKHHRQGADHFLLDQGRHARVGSLALALGRALEPDVHAGQMSGRGKGKGKEAATQRRESPAGELVAAKVSAKAAAKVAEAAPVDGQKEPRRRRRGTVLEERVGYRFKDGALLDCALTHISALKGARNRAGSYQRLEFLGDHVLGLVISDVLFRAFPKADEGELSRRLADLVRKETCAEIAVTIELGAAIKLGSSEANAGARKRPAILADVCEALIGAVYLDGGYPAAEGLVERLWQVRMQAKAQPLRDSKTVLQEWAQARGLPTPVYREVARTGPDHSPVFCVAVQLPNFAPAEGSGRSKRGAEQAAATAMLARERVKPERRNG